MTNKFNADEVFFEGIINFMDEFPKAVQEFWKAVGEELPFLYKIRDWMVTMDNEFNAWFFDRIHTIRADRGLWKNYMRKIFVTLIDGDVFSFLYKAVSYVPVFLWSPATIEYRKEIEANYEITKRYQKEGIWHKKKKYFPFVIKTVEIEIDKENPKYIKIS